MKLHFFAFRSRRAFTAVDALVVLATLVLASIVGLPRLARPSCCHIRIKCVNNLRQLGIAFRLWSNDNGERLPWQSTNTVDTILEPYAYCLMASNDLNSPKILVCPEDVGRVRAVAFDQNFSNTNLSYFLGLDADETKPNTLLSGDRTLSTNKAILSGLLTLEDSKRVNWAPGIHEDGGNIGFADGSSQQVSTRSIRSMMDNGKIQIPTRLLIP